MKKPNFSWKRVADSFSTRSFRVGGYSVAAAAIVLAIAVMVNVFAAALPASVTKFDTTANQLFTLSEQTEKLVSGLTDEVTVYWIVRSGREESYLESLLSRYQSLSDKIRVVKKDPDVFPTFTQQYTDSFTENSLIVEAGERYRYVDYNDIFVMDYTSYYYYGTESWSFCGESELTSAIDYVVSENLPKVYLLTGHGESSLSDSFASAVKQQNIETAELSLLTLESVPADTDCILINAPQSDISLDEQSKLLEYLGNGGNLFLITDPPKSGELTNLEALMADYGVTTVDGIVVESFGRGNVPPYVIPGIARALEKGIIVVNATRTGGRVLDEYGYEGGMLQQHKMGVIMAGELSAAKARLKLMLILSQYGPDGRPDPAEVARYFEHSM